MIDISKIKPIAAVNRSDRKRRSDRRKVVQYSLKGKPMVVHESTWDAVRKLFPKEKDNYIVRYKATAIARTASKYETKTGYIQKSAYGFQWRYLDDINKDK